MPNQQHQTAHIPSGVRRNDMFAGLFANFDRATHVVAVAPTPAADVNLQRHDDERFVDAELTLFLAEPNIPRFEVLADGNIELNNPLHWWKHKRVRYPIISIIAKGLLCIPATSASSERLFSTAGLTIAADRARLLPDNAALLIFLHENWTIANAWLAARNLPLL